MTTPSTPRKVTMPRPPIDPELVPFQNEIPDWLNNLTPETVLQTRGLGPPPDLTEIIEGRPLTHEERCVPGPEGNTSGVTLSIFTPDEKSSTPRPCIFYMHGGGMIFGDRYQGVTFPLDAAVECNAICISVEYRLAPDHPFPAGVEDCFSGLQWTCSHASELGIDPSRIMIGGLSGGGALAASLALLWRDRVSEGKVEGQICGQLLSAPMLDDRGATVSFGQYDERNVVTKMWDFVLGEGHEQREVSYYASAARAESVAGLPTAFIDVGGAECLRDESVEYASKLWACGVQAELHVWEGGFHAFEEFAPETALAMASKKVRMAWVKKVFQVQEQSKARWQKWSTKMCN